MVTMGDHTSFVLPDVVFTSFYNAEEEHVMEGDGGGGEEGVITINPVGL